MSVKVMKFKGTEEKILHDALEVFQKTTKLTAEIQPIPYYTIDEPDALIRIALQDMEWHFDTEVKNRLTRATLILVALQLQKFHRRRLLVTKYVTPQMADQLKKMNIPFIDAAGNAFINEPPLFIFIKGNKLIDTYHTERPTRAFRPTGLQVVFTLLCNPGLENKPFRKIAKEATVALGTVGWVMRDLKQMGFLIDMGKRGRRLVQKEELLKRWVITYPEQLRPKKLLGRYKTKDFDWWKHTNLQNYQAYWGGEIAAAKLTKYLKPQIATIYANQPLGRLILDFKLNKDPNGNVEILNVFWNFKQNWQHHALVHPVLIYADLLATGDDRNIETAGIIYEHELARFVRED